MEERRRLAVGEPAAWNRKVTGKVDWGIRCKRDTTIEGITFTDGVAATGAENRAA